MSASFRRRAARDEGQALVILVLGLSALLAVLALAINASFMWVAQHQAQSAADAGALAAAQDLTGSGAASDATSATADGTSVADGNDHALAVQVTAPYDNDATSARVVVSKSFTLPFGETASVRETATATNNVVRNGSFNATFSKTWIEYCATNGLTDTGPYASACTAANPDMGSWTVYSGGVDLNNVSYITAPPWDPTAQSIDLDGSCSYDATTKNCDNVTNGEIYEPLSTVPGQTYTLNFDLSENPHGPPATKPMAVYVSQYPPAPDWLNYATPVTTFDGAAAGETWTPEQRPFTAPGSTTYLWFVSQVGCVASNQTAPNTSTSVADDCNNGAAITDIVVTGPLNDDLTQ